MHRNVETQKIRLQWQSLNGSDIVGRIPRKISRNDRETSRTLLYNDRLLLYYVLLSTSTKILAGRNFCELVQTHEKRENLHPAKLTGYTVLVQQIDTLRRHSIVRENTNSAASPDGCHGDRNGFSQAALGQ